MNLTGDQIRAVREKLGLDRVRFASILGVSTSSVYRWETSGPDAVRFDKLQADLLETLDARTAAGVVGGATTIRAVRQIAMNHGAGLVGLHKLLGVLLVPAKELP